MDRCLWKQDDEYPNRIVREIRNRSNMVRRGEDVDRERSGANEAWIITGSICEWHGVAGCKDRFAGDGGSSGSVERRWNGE
jgi:hypothetical protein